MDKAPFCCKISICIYRIFILFCFRFTDANLSFTNRSYYQPYQNSTSYPPIILPTSAESKQLFYVIFEESIIYSILVSFYTRISVIDFYIKLMERWWLLFFFFLFFLINQMPLRKLTRLLIDGIKCAWFYRFTIINPTNNGKGKLYIFHFILTFWPDHKSTFVFFLHSCSIFTVRTDKCTRTYV